MEATLLSLTPAQVAGLTERRPRIGRIWQGFKRDVERPIAVILLLNTTAHTVGASIAGAQFGEVFGEEHLWLFARLKGVPEAAVRAEHAAFARKQAEKLRAYDAEMEAGARLQAEAEARARWRRRPSAALPSGFGRARPALVSFRRAR